MLRANPRPPDRRHNVVWGEAQRRFRKTLEVSGEAPGARL